MVVLALQQFFKAVFRFYVHIIAQWVAGCAVFLAAIHGFSIIITSARRYCDPLCLFVG